MTLPLYHSVSQEPPERTAEGHAGLWFDKFCNSWNRSNGSWSMRGKKQEWLRTLTRTPVGSKAEIDEHALRVVRLIERSGGMLMVLSTQSRFVTGSGRSDPVENGFTWHPTLGIPYLPGSSAKGMIRAWAGSDADPRPDQGIIDRMLGTRDGIGNIGFLDAVPIEPVRLEIDVMTPHYVPWTEDDPPGDWKSPTPIPFLVTAARTPFLFGIIPRSSDSGEDMDLAERWLQEALEQAGAGAKTSVGYGRFVRDEAKTAKLRNLLRNADRQREERIRIEMEAKSRKEWLDSLSPVERRIQEVINNQTDPNMQNTVAVFKEIETGHWSADEKLEAARWLKSEMEAKGTWKPVTRAKKPEKDKRHKRTLQVRCWLDGQ